MDVDQALNLFRTPDGSDPPNSEELSVAGLRRMREVMPEPLVQLGMIAPGR